MISKVVLGKFQAIPEDFIVIKRKNGNNKNPTKKIEINLQKLERGLRTERVKVTRGGKTFYRKQRVGRKENGDGGKGKSKTIVPDEFESLFKEAKKYKNAKEFIDNQERVYHGTNKQSAESIRKEGFIPGRGIGGMSGTPSKYIIFVSPHKKSASYFAKENIRSTKFGGSEVIDGRITGKLLEIKGVMQDFSALGKVHEILNIPFKIEGSATHIIDFDALEMGLKNKGYVGIKFKDSLSNRRLSYAVFGKNIVNTDEQLNEFYNKYVVKE